VETYHPPVPVSLTHPQSIGSLRQVLTYLCYLHPFSIWCWITPRHQPMWATSQCCDRPIFSFRESCTTESASHLTSPKHVQKHSSALDLSLVRLILDFCLFCVSSKHIECLSVADPLSWLVLPAEPVFSREQRLRPSFPLSQKGARLELNT